jgi:flagellin-like protein
MKNKRGISPIIATTLLIAIIILLGVIIYNFSIRFFRGQEAETESFSFYYDIELSILLDSGSFSLSGLDDLDNLTLGIRRIDNQDFSNQTFAENEENLIKGVRFNFEDDKGNSYSYDDYNNPPLMPGFSYTYQINLTDLGIASWQDVEEISARLFYGQNKITGVLDEIVLDE